MAKEYHYCEGCGAETVAYATNRAEAQRKLKWWQETRPLCGKCEGKKEYAEAKAKAHELELVPLIGTVAQVEYAERIRVPRIADLMVATETDGDQMILPQWWSLAHSSYAAAKPTREYIEIALSRICAIDDAVWWIERGRENLNFIERIVADFKHENKPVNDPAIAEAVTFEATLRPETPVTETIATFEMRGAKIWICFPEKREDFRDAVKAFGCRWDDGIKKWTLQVNADQVNATAIEIGAHLLGSGFVVRVLDTDVREAIKSGDVTKSDGRRIDYAGKDHFRVDWRRIDGDYYDEVRKIPLSKWDKTNQTVLVPIGATDDLRDFAKRFGFPMTEQATAAADAFDAYRRAGMVDGRKRKKGEVVEILDRGAFPDVIKIDASLLD